jgi:hypothetical protein
VDHGERGPHELQSEEQAKVVQDSQAPLPLFPIEDHLVELLRAGRIKSLAKRPSEDRHQDLSAADWAGLEIAELVGLKVARSGANCLFVLLSQPDILLEFPELPATATVKPPDLRTVLRNGIEAKGAMLTQAEAEKIAGRAGVTEDRKKIREVLRLVGSSDRTGPKGPRKNRADRTA